jgi:ornithine cyclodeaminase/alanine dehydrogenase-like protein (mu-crystallin family)
MHDAPLRYLSAAHVAAAMPGITERLVLAEGTMVALGAGAELPPKIGVHPAPVGSFAHAMPALLRGSEVEDTPDLLGMKWVAGFPSNAAAGLPAIHGTTILSDAATGRPRAFIDAGALTAHRTAAVSGVAIARWGPPTGRAARVALIGAGAQARSHLPVIAHLLPGAEVVLCDRDAARAEMLARDLGDPASRLGSWRAVHTMSDPLEAVSRADLVLTLVSFGPQHQILPAEAFSKTATIVAVDYDMCVPADLATSAGLFLVDHRQQYQANRTPDVFAGYPEAPTTIGEAIRAETRRPADRVLVTHLGVGLADVVFADAVLRVAETRGIGTILER